MKELILYQGKIFKGFFVVREVIKYLESFGSELIECLNLNLSARSYDVEFCLYVFDLWP